MHVIENKNMISEGILAANICFTADARRPFFVPSPPDSHPLTHGCVGGWALPKPDSPPPSVRGWTPRTRKIPPDLDVKSESGWPLPGGRVGGLPNPTHDSQMQATWACRHRKIVKYSKMSNIFMAHNNSVPSAMT